MTNERNELLKAALVGFRQQAAGLSAKIEAIEQELRGKAERVVRRPRKALKLVGVPKAAKKRKMSAAGREAVRKAQIKRWAAVKKAKEAAA